LKRRTKNIRLSEKPIESIPCPEALTPSFPTKVSKKRCGESVTVAHWLRDMLGATISICLSHEDLSTKKQNGCQTAVVLNPILR
jgi:hypothetical protein